MIICGDCREILPTLSAGSVQCCVTSPPYWGLRDYGTAQWEGGEMGCDHQAPNGQGTNGDRADRTFTANKPYKLICAKCGARRIDSQLGLEESPSEYITKMVAVFREVWRVLRDDGTLWVNMGDSYAGPNGWKPEDQKTSTLGPNRDGLKPTNAAFISKPKRSQVIGLKPKDLCGIPWRLAFALQAAGWYLRSDIIWAKPNPMPESVTDRPTKAHEYIFLLTKMERYFYDAEAIREKTSENIPWGNTVNSGQFENNRYIPKSTLGIPLENGFRNKRTVWTIATQPYSECHFATFPEEIPKLCILAGSKPGDTILDPFAGSGTVGKVALELGRKPILIELNQEYVQLIKWRTFITPGFF